MSLNLEYNGYHYFDEYNMCLIRNDSLSFRDSVGRTVLAWIAYGRPQELADALLRCYHNGVLYRHPEHDEPASRDHRTYFTIYKKLTLSTDDFNLFMLEFIPNNILSKYNRGTCFWSWSLVNEEILHLERIFQWLYYAIYIPGARIGNFWNSFVRYLGDISNERPEELWGASSVIQGNTVGTTIQQGLTKRQKFFRKLLIPTFSLHVKAWQIYVLPASKKKDKLKRILLKRVGRYNYLLRLLYGDTTITKEEVEGYKHMSSYRWGVNLDESCDRDVRFVPEDQIEFNGLEVDLLKHVYNTILNEEKNHIS